MILRKKSKILLLAHTLNRSPLTLRYGRRRKARASPRRGGEPRNSVIRALGDSRANTLAVASPLGESPNYVVLPRGGGRRAPPAASHRTCMGPVLFFFERCVAKIPKCLVLVRLSIQTQNNVRFLPKRLEKFPENSCENSCSTSWTPPPFPPPLGCCTP